MIKVLEQNLLFFTSEKVIIQGMKLTGYTSPYQNHYLSAMFQEKKGS